jgi:hypothetical protein
MTDVFHLYISSLFIEYFKAPKVPFFIEFLLKNLMAAG